MRSEGGRYFEEGDPALERLTLDYVFKPDQDLYGRVSVGYLEPMFAGVSTELLWKPADQNWALGAEVNFARQRDYDQLFGFRDYQTVSGHASLYVDLRNGFEGRVDVGRYLAGDWGATIALDRTFNNGWKVGANGRYLFDRRRAACRATR
ncbi:YjbH domain-containing protein [Halovulum sp. GXIMD14793]